MDRLVKMVSRPTLWVQCGDKSLTLNGKTYTQLNQEEYDAVKAAYPKAVLSVIELPNTEKKAEKKEPVVAKEEVQTQLKVVEEKKPPKKTRTRRKRTTKVEK